MPHSHDEHHELGGRSDRRPGTGIEPPSARPALGREGAPDEATSGRGADGSPPDTDRRAAVAARRRAAAQVAGSLLVAVVIATGAVAAVTAKLGTTSVAALEAEEERAERQEDAREERAREHEDARDERRDAAEDARDRRRGGR